VSTTPVINLSPVSTTPPITEILWQRLIAGVVDTGDKFSAVALTLPSSLSPVSLTPLIKIHLRLSPRIFEKSRNYPNGILRGLGLGDIDS
jgi:hypothetical protein